MEKPNLKDARIRTHNKVNIIRNFRIDDELKEIGKNKKYLVKTYGCQMNERDSENICAMLEGMGYTRTNTIDNADLVILNTCAIRENAHNKVFGMLGRLKHLKEERPIMVGVCGCMAQEEVVVNEIMTKNKHVDFVLGTHNLHRLPEVIKKSIDKNALEVEVWSKEGDIIEDIPIKRESKYKAWVNIMYGCDKFCTYCIVPYTRGKERSRELEEIIKEVEELKNSGYKEITLLGQNVNSYGKDLNNGTDFATLLEAVAKTGIDRIRFTTSHPWDFNADMIDIIAKYDNIMPSIHLPVQSGNDDVLQLMGRRYSKESYLKLFDMIKEKIPDCTVTTDIIVGFPNETEEQFQDTLSLYNYCKYDLAYTFIYSPREGTPAAKMEDNVPLSDKEQRLYRLNELVNKYANEANQKYLGQVVKVLVEGPSKKNPDVLSGYTEHNKLINFKGDASMVGQIVDVRVTEAKTWALTGKQIENSN